MVSLPRLLIVCRRLIFSPFKLYHVFALVIFRAAASPRNIEKIVENIILWHFHDSVIHLGHSLFVPQGYYYVTSPVGRSRLFAGQ